MRRTRKRDLLAAVLLGLCGCVTANQEIKPPELPEQYRSPPGEDRYLAPPRFPRDTLNQGLIQKREEENAGQPGGPGGQRGGSGPLRSPASGPSYN